MKSLVESILSSTKTGKDGILNDIRGGLNGRRVCTENYYMVPNITFDTFLEFVDADTFASILDRCWKDAKKDYDKGMLDIVFKDGVLMIEIAKMSFVGSRRDNSTWWRELFVKNEDIKKDAKNERIYDHLDECEKYCNNGGCSFTSGWGDRLKNILPDYIKYLKKHYKDLVK